MKKAGRVRTLAIVLLLVLLISVPAVMAARKGASSMTLTISDQKSGEIYLTASCHPEDTLSFGWEHSFEHVTWNEFYTICEDGSLKLHTIAVGGFGAGIPAEMDCTYRYEEGLIYMENLAESEFESLNWIHSRTQVKFLKLNDTLLCTGEDLPQREKLTLTVTR